ncbi:hypothetical protein [Parapedobacter pyrenivorans]|uniref:hypothetical protein n=1 Tax=Parapedobacter pyrenivorans TaxID=1305674 RepID=UPI0016632901|nr:hypothetical protein [Parapedobacter pyrenivorans]
MKRNDSIRANLAWFQAILFCLIVASGTVFMHKHKTRDGRIVIHTHPYNLKTGPDNPSHHESDSQIHLLDVIFQGSFVQPLFLRYDQPIITPVSIAYQTFCSPGRQPHSFRTIYLRGPPRSC